MAVIGAVSGKAETGKLARQVWGMFYMCQGVPAAKVGGAPTLGTLKKPAETGLRHWEVASRSGAPVDLERRWENEERVWKRTTGAIQGSRGEQLK